MRDHKVKKFIQVQTPTLGQLDEGYYLNCINCSVEFYKIMRQISFYCTFTVYCQHAHKSLCKTDIA